MKFQITAVCTGDCLLDDMPEHKSYSASELPNFLGELSLCHPLEERSLMLIALVTSHLISQTLSRSQMMMGKK